MSWLLYHGLIERPVIFGISIGLILVRDTLNSVEGRGN
jgi:hypothetical protein